MTLTPYYAPDEVEGMTFKLCEGRCGRVRAIPASRMVCADCADFEAGIPPPPKTPSGRRPLRHGNAKLTEEEVREIKGLLGDGYSGYRVAALYDVTPATIYWIKKGVTWGWVK